jgi:AraC-like DNA-binding protein
MSSEQDIVDDVRRTLLKNPGESYNLNSVAKELAVSSRTLRRRLQEADTSFRVIQTEVRMSLAGEYLSHTPLPIAEIAHLLGYSDVTAFHRSFKKHFDVTPAQYRK